MAELTDALTIPETPKGAEYVLDADRSVTLLAAVELVNVTFEPEAVPDVQLAKEVPLVKENPFAVALVNEL